MVLKCALSFCLAAAVAAASATPEQVHVAFAGSDAQGSSDGMVVSWYTANPTATSTVQFGTASGKLDQTATGTSVAYLPVGVVGDGEGALLLFLFL
jgi:hypothetical protein